MSDYLVQEIEANKRVRVLTSTVVVEAHGDANLEAVAIRGDLIHPRASRKVGGCFPVPSGRLGKSTASTSRPKGICLGPPGLVGMGVSARRVLPGEPIHRLPDEIGVAHVPRVLLYQVDQDAPQAG